MRKVALLVAAFALVTGCGYQGVPAAEAPPVNGDPVTTSQPVGAGVPVSLEIDKLGVTDNIVPVQVQPDGAMEVPSVDETGWWDASPHPGNPGAAMILSHVNFKGVKGAFSRLHELVVGDELTITDDAGTVRRFAVVEKRTFKKSAFDENQDLLFGDTGTADLVAVTCGGTLVGHSYDSNVAIRARLVA